MTCKCYPVNIPVCSSPLFANITDSCRSDKINVHSGSRSILPASQIVKLINESIHIKLLDCGTTCEAD